MAAQQDFTWHQGEDFPISLIYKLGPAGSEVPVDLTSYSLRMDVAADDGSILTILNDENIADTDPYTVGNQGDTTDEVTMGADGSIQILLGRALTLPGGPFVKYLAANPSRNTFSYDVFLRNPAGKQTKILFGTLTLIKSVTKW